MTKTTGINLDRSEALQCPFHNKMHICIFIGHGGSCFHISSTEKCSLSQWEADKLTTNFLQGGHTAPPNSLRREFL